MLISKIGEFGLIERLKKSIKLDSSVVKGIGDDCAVIKFTNDKYLLFTTDMLIEDVHFRRGALPFYIGHKAMACSISDIAAMGGEPKYAVISLGLPRDLSVKFIDDIYKGIRQLAKRFNINIVGGDTNRANKIIIDVSLIGVVEKERVVKRDGAKNGDIIMVSGSLGGSLYGRHLKFMPRLKDARFLVSNFKLNSMIDISDGLFSDLKHILKASRTGAIIYEQLIPKSPQAKSSQEALFMGEDFELLFTASLKEAKKIIANNKFKFTAIGEILAKDKKLKFITKECAQRIFFKEGFRHF